jgi:hypothetical protein
MSRFDPSAAGALADWYSVNQCFKEPASRNPLRAIAGIWLAICARRNCGGIDLPA